MGVEGLSQWVEKAQLVRKFTSDRYRGKRVAVDTSAVGYKLMARAHAAAVTQTGIDEPKRFRLWLEKFCVFIGEMYSAGITPVFINDGPPPPEKSATLAERHKTKTKKTATVATLQQAIEATPELERTPAQYKELREAIVRDMSLPFHYIKRLTTFLHEAGIPCFDSTTEADPLCAALALEGIVAAVISTDSDLLLHGTPELITKWGPDYSAAHEELIVALEVVSRDEILAHAGITHHQLITLGLLSGTDYNYGVKGTGPAKALKALKAGYTDPAEYNDIPTTRLRQLFSYEPHDQLIAGYTPDAAGRPVYTSVDTGTRFLTALSNASPYTALGKYEWVAAAATAAPVPASTVTSTFPPA